MRYCFALDLKDDPELILEYRRHHEKIWPEVRDSIVRSGIMEMEIYLVENRLFMIMEVSDSFSFDEKVKADLSNPKVQEWERLMWRYQQPIPGSAKGQKWRLMEKIFTLSNQD